MKMSSTPNNAKPEVKPGETPPDTFPADEAFSVKRITVSIHPPIAEKS